MISAPFTKIYVCGWGLTGGSAYICRRMATYVQDGNPTYGEHEKGVIQGRRHPVERKEEAKGNLLPEASGGEV